MNTINFEEGRVNSINKWFPGVYIIDGVEYPYTLMSNWNDWDEWTVDEVSWEDQEPEDRERIEEEIREQFIAHFYPE